MFPLKLPDWDIKNLKRKVFEFKFFFWSLRLKKLICLKSFFCGNQIVYQGHKRGFYGHGVNIFHRLINNTDRILDVVFSRFRGFSFTITITIPKGLLACGFEL